MTLCQSLSRFSLPYTTALEMTFGRALTGSSAQTQSRRGRFSKSKRLKYCPATDKLIGKKEKIYYIKMLLSVAGETLPFFGVFYCYLAALVSSCQLLSCNSSGIFWALGVPPSQPAPALAAGSKGRHYLWKQHHSVNICCVTSQTRSKV